MFFFLSSIRGNQVKYLKYIHHERDTYPGWKVKKRHVFVVKLKDTHPGCKVKRGDYVKTMPPQTS